MAWIGGTRVGIAGVDVGSGREVVGGAPAVVHGARQVSLAMKSSLGPENSRRRSRQFPLECHSGWCCVRLFQTCGSCHGGSLEISMASEVHNSWYDDGAASKGESFWTGQDVPHRSPGALYDHVMIGRLVIAPRADPSSQHDRNLSGES